MKEVYPPAGFGTAFDDASQPAAKRGRPIRADGHLQIAATTPLAERSQPAPGPCPLARHFRHGIINRVAGVALAVAVTAAFVLVVYLYAGAGESNLEQGDRIVAALEQYQGERGQYPGGLNDLVPMYLPVVPVPDGGAPQWIYSTTDAGAGFTLGVVSPRERDWNATYSSATHAWEVDQK